ncbi:hypothetical protein BDP27DRAFT_1044107 [Rhodocollybia butyracea]|uniref:Uncharacterized protein n=1 Tax=Rhodocollybia butyracea TaxID=206335 RepID=A0A9P5Q6Y3_9AGAR|nr:hypothetical protein BDP27DRAFT_1044107 [Rhodocollybia butyracea]
MPCWAHDIIHLIVPVCVAFSCSVVFAMKRTSLYDDSRNIYSAQPVALLTRFTRAIKFPSRIYIEAYTYGTKERRPTAKSRL